MSAFKPRLRSEAVNNSQSNAEEPTFFEGLSNAECSIDDSANNASLEDNFVVSGKVSPPLVRKKTKRTPKMTKCEESSQQDQMGQERNDTIKTVLIVGGIIGVGALIAIGVAAIAPVLAPLVVMAGKKDKN